MRRISIAVFIASLLAASALADEKHHARGPLTEGEVRKIDKNAKKITIKHGPISNLEMPAMTMVFQIKDPAMLEQLKAGDKVKFEAQKLGGAYTVTQIEKAN